MTPIIFTDLDASLLDEETFSCQPVLPVIEEITRSGVMIIPNTSKTRVETEAFLASINLNAPFSVENGANFLGLDQIQGALPPAWGSNRFGLDIEEVNRRWEQIGANQINVRDLMAKCLMLDEMNSADQTSILGLGCDDLTRAMQRSHSRLLLFDGSLDELDTLKNAVSDAGLKITKGGRVFTLSGIHNKAMPLQYLRDHFTRAGLKLPQIIAIGDGENDLDMLQAADIPCVIPRKNGFRLDLPDAPNPVFATEPAPSGWHYCAKIALERLGIAVK